MAYFEKAKTSFQPLLPAFLDEPTCEVKSACIRVGWKGRAYSVKLTLSDQQRPEALTVFLNENLDFQPFGLPTLRYN